MNGAEALLRTLTACGVEVCFTNPGTSEMQFVAAADRVPDMRTVLALFEGVASGAADGYGRMLGKPAATLLHLGPGLGNALANFHNAMRAETPIVNLVGDHATWHAQYDAPLTSDVACYAATVSGWIRTVSSAAETPGAAAEAARAAAGPPGRIATLIVPADASWDEGAEPAQALAPPEPARVTGDVVAAVAEVLRREEPVTLLLNGTALAAEGVALASAIAARHGARVLTDTFFARQERGAGRARIDRLPYFVDAAREALAGTRHLILVNTREPVSFFAYPDSPSLLKPGDCERMTLAAPGEDGVDALARLADALGVNAAAADLAPHDPPPAPSGALTLETFAQAVASVLPEGAIVSDEAATSGGALLPMTETAAPHDWLTLTGGAIGQGLPLATGAAVACPDRRVLALQADGGGMYTLQALWTQARESLNVVNVILANREYRILNMEFARVGAGEQGPKARDMLSLDRPPLDWVSLARGMGVPASRVERAEELHRALAAGLNEDGPSLIEVML